MKISTALIFTVFLCLFCVSVDAQVKEISEQEYYRAGSAVFTASGPVERTEKSTHQYFTDGVLTFESIEITERDTKGSFRTTTRKKSGGKESVSIDIFIGEARYSKNDDGEWTRSAGGGFATDVRSVSGGDILVTTKKYTVEEVVDGPFKTKIYTITTLFETDGHSTVVSNKKFLSNIGWLEKTEYRVVKDGVVQEAWTSTFEYSNGKIKIEAPIR